MALEMKTDVPYLTRLPQDSSLKVPILTLFGNSSMPMNSTCLIEMTSPHSSLEDKISPINAFSSHLFVIKARSFEE